MDKEHLADLWQMMPEDRIKPVTLYRRLEDSQLDTGNPIRVGASDKRPLEIKISELIEDADIEIETATFHLYVSTFSPSLDAAASGTRVRKDWVIEEANGDRWKIQRADLKQMDTRYLAHCTRLLGKIT